MSNGASLRQIRRRIRTVENTKKITRAMEMIAAAKLRRFQDFLESARPHTERLETLLNDLLGEVPSNYDHPFFERQRTPEHVALVLFTSDTGLCGTYNRDLEEATRQFFVRNPDRKIHFVFVGKHGGKVFHRTQAPVLENFSDLRVSRVDVILQGLRETLERAFLRSEIDEIHAIYTRAESLSRYHPVSERILPIPKKMAAESIRVPTLLEPSAKSVFDRLLPTYFEARLRFIFYHALLTEQIARMTAMRQATQNAEDMIEELTLLRNKARQAAITKEIIEVVSGSRALKMK